MLLPRWVKKIVEAVQNESNAVQESFQKYERSERHRNEASEQKQGEIAGVIASAIKTAHEDVPSYEKTQRDKEYRLQKRLFWATVIAAFVAAIYAAIAALQWVALNESLGIDETIARESRIQAVAAMQAANAAQNAVSQAQDEWRLEQRPYLFGEPRGTFDVTDHPGQKAVFKPIGGNFVFDVAVNLSNPGKSPAIEIESTDSKFIIGPHSEALRGVLAYAPEYKSGTRGAVLVPGTATIVARSNARTLTGEEFYSVMAGTWDIYVVGAVRYRDIFSPRQSLPYETTYCFHINTTGLPFADCNFGPGHFGTSLK
jgi:hypothetical protein